MRHSKETVDVAMPNEPPNGTRLIVDNGDNEYKVIWRDDAEAKNWAGQPGEHWFEFNDSDPMRLYEHLKYATEVWVVAGNPIPIADRAHP